MIVVSDTSPLITLARIDCLGLLQSLFGMIHVPREVEQELSAKGAGQGVPDILSLMQGWLVVQNPSVPQTFPGLHPGESAAISLALEYVSILLIDEKAGRNVASVNGVTVIGTVGVLLEAAERGQIDLASTFARLKTTNFRFPEATLDALLEQFNQRHPN